MEMRYWRRRQLTLADRVRNEEIRNRMEIGTTTVDTIAAKSLRWYEHVQRMRRDRLPKELMKWAPARFNKIF